VSGRTTPIAGSTTGGSTSTLILGTGSPDRLVRRTFYQRALGGFAGAPTFFAEWQVQTEAPSRILEHSGVPVVLVLEAEAPPFTTRLLPIRASSSSVIRQFPCVVDIEPDVPHTYRVEVDGTASYTWYIDAQPVDGGVPEGHIRPKARSSGGGLGTIRSKQLLAGTTCAMA